jgi:hypothetical protein
VARIGRPPKCECGECRLCVNRIKMRLKYQAMTPEERRAKYEALDKEKCRATDRARYYRHKAKRIANATDWARKNRARRHEHLSGWIERNPEKVKAQTAVSNAVRDGRLTRQPCEVCGNPKVDGHHEDYSKPLEVRWLCRAHHMELHRRYPAAA